MPSLIGNSSSALYGELDLIGSNKDKEKKSIKGEKIYEIQSKGNSTTQKRRLRSQTTRDSPISSPSKPCSPTKWKLPRRCISGSPNSSGISKESNDKLSRFSKSLQKRLSDTFLPKYSEQMNAVKEVLHVSTTPSVVVCREEEQKRVLELCKGCIEQEKAGSVYVCGCPGTGKSLSMEKVKQLLVGWAEEILEKYQPRKKISVALSPLQHLQNLFSQKKQSSGEKMMLIIVDELDYLITKDRSVLHDLFMLTTYPFSRCLLIGIANAIDLADRFLPRLQPLNCKPMVVTFRAYSKDQILKILQERLMALPYNAFQPQALELCARKVAAASGDMRKALCVCRSAIEMLEVELRDPTCNMNLVLVEKTLCGQQTAPPTEFSAKQEIDTVRVDHMAIALTKTFKSPVVDIIQSLPQHQQIILCSAVKLFRRGKKDTTVGELNRFYSDICKSVLIPQVGILELSSMCRGLSDQGLLKLGQSREDKLKRVTLQVDEADIIFALQGIRFFQNCLQ
ncbi:hypothetical protein HHK36_018545 [Tetracentron sinense]|uniref:Cell division control protein n=1 Tax=Tetracentron sinense TaxID=13715 RepID=A0A834YZP4_TETSI|nr:hypothetical protein HHK36_018545 [Tetracentron sinense]